MPRTGFFAKLPEPNAAAAYGAALAVGLLAIGMIFPHWALIGALPPAGPPGADFADQVVAQRYFFAQHWHWHLLHIDGLMAPWGINLAFADGIPLAALTAKLLRPLLPPFDQVVTLWLALCWLLQPVAAVFALRSTSERRRVPALCVAVLAACQPVFLDRLHHATLSAHFALLLLLGCTLRAVAGSRAALWAGCAIAAGLVLVHPYLLFMGMAFPAATSLTLLTRRNKSWRESVLALAISLGVVVLAAFGLGLTEGGNAGVYGAHTLNLMGFFYPAESGLFPGFPVSRLDGAAGHPEGYAYLGAGLLLILACVLLRPRLVWHALSRQPGLAVAGAVLTGLAVSNHVFLFRTQLFHLHMATGWLDVFRASGRFAWVGTYTLLIGGVAALLRGWPRAAQAILPVAAILAVLDARVLLARDRHFLTDPAPFLFDPAEMRPVLRAQASLTILPPFGCIDGTDMQVMQPLYLAADTLMATNTMYIGRKTHRPACDMAIALARPPEKGKVIVIQPDLVAAAMHAPIAAFCRQIGAYGVCTRDGALLAGLPPLHMALTGSASAQPHQAAMHLHPGS